MGHTTPTTFACQRVLSQHSENVECCPLPDDEDSGAGDRLGHSRPSLINANPRPRMKAKAATLAFPALRWSSRKLPRLTGSHASLTYPSFTEGSWKSGVMVDHSVIVHAAILAHGWHPKPYGPMEAWWHWHWSWLVAPGEADMLVQPRTRLIG